MNRFSIALLLIGSLCFVPGASLMVDVPFSTLVSDVFADSI